MSTPRTPHLARFHVAAVAAIMVLLPCAAEAQRWTHAASEHFEVYTTGGERRARTALTYFERVHGFFEDFLKLSPVQKHPTRLIIFSNRREFTPYRFNEVATAYYLAGPDRDYIVMEGLDAESYPLVVHEYAHLIIRHSGAAYPRWLNEGLAEFFSTLSPNAGQMSLGRVPLGRLMELREGGSLLDLPRLFAVDHNSTEYTSRNHAGTFYAQSWALTHMLMTTDAYREGVDRFLRSVADGQSAADALQAVYGRTPVQVFGDLQSYIRRDRFNYFNARYRDPRAESSFPIRAVDAFEAASVTANLLAEAPNRTAEARAAYEALLAQRPGDADLLGARGYFELRRGDQVAAADYLQRAVDAGSENATVYRWAARLAPSAEARESLLARAVALDPTNVEIRLAHAGALINQRKATEAFDALVPITRVTPEQAYSFFELKALVALQLDQIEEARQAIARARQYASGGPEVDAGERLASSINEYADRRAGAARMIADTRFPTAAGSDRPLAPTSNPATAAPSTVGLPGSGPLTLADGRFRHLHCASTPPVIEVLTGDGLVRLVIDDPLAIRIVGANGPTTDLTCGAQDQAVRIGFRPDPDVAGKTAGALRLLEFR